MPNENYSILVVDDEKAVRDNIVAYLKLSYENIFEASNGNEAYDLYKEKHLDLMITDINMPQMDGLTLVEKIRADESDLPIIIVSAHSEQDKLLRAVKLKLVDYVIKPIVRKTLIALITKVKKLSDKSDIDLVTLDQGFVFDRIDKILYEKDEIVVLTRQLTLLLEQFILNKNRVLSSVDIYFNLHDGFDTEYSNGLVRNLVFKLRQILPKEMIKNIYGGGYMFCMEVEK